MDKTQAEIISQAILEPALRAQDEATQNREKAARVHARNQHLAWFCFSGFGLGAAIAHFSSFPLVTGALAGVVAGSLVGWLIAGRVA